MGRSLVAGWIEEFSGGGRRQRRLLSCPEKEEAWPESNWNLRWRKAMILFFVPCSLRNEHARDRDPGETTTQTTKIKERVSEGLLFDWTCKART